VTSLCAHLGSSACLLRDRCARPARLGRLAAVVEERSPARSISIEGHPLTVIYQGSSESWPGCPAPMTIVVTVLRLSLHRWASDFQRHAAAPAREW
jgi:hypothetical protein